MILLADLRTWLFTCLDSIFLDIYNSFLFDIISRYLSSNEHLLNKVRMKVLTYVIIYTKQSIFRLKYYFVSVG